MSLARSRRFFFPRKWYPRRVADLLSGLGPFVPVTHNGTNLSMDPEDRGRGVRDPDTDACYVTGLPERAEAHPAGFALAEYLSATPQHPATPGLLGTALRTAVPGLGISRRIACAESSADIEESSPRERDQ